MSHAAIRLLVCLTTFILAVPASHAVDDEHRAKARAVLDRASAFLLAQQDEKTGGWSIPADGPVFPAITALVLSATLSDEPGAPHDPRLARAAAFLLSMQQPDGGIYDRVLPSYNTAIALSALARIDTPEARAAVLRAQDFVRSLQYGEAAVTGGPEPPAIVEKSHPFYGGLGYGRHGRPDLSNLSFALQGLHDSGVPADDPAFQRALVFLSRVQMLDTVNEMSYADGSRQGGFIYATSVNRDEQGVGQSPAGVIEESLDDGTKVSRLRAYGSMTYAGFKSLIYADLRRDDPRVLAAFEWIRRHYTLDENPGLGTDGMYYYFLMLARSLDAWFDADPTDALPDRLTVIAPDGTEIDRDWANDLIDRLADLQEPDGSFRVLDDRWMENNPVLITAYAMIALRHAAD